MNLLNETISKISITQKKATLQQTQSSVAGGVPQQPKQCPQQSVLGLLGRNPMYLNRGGE